MPINYDTDGQILMAVQRYFEPEHGLPEELEDDLRRLDDAHAATVAALEERVAEITRERDGFQALLGDAREALEAVRDMGAIDEPAHDRAVMGLVESDPRELLASVAIHSEEGGRR